MPLANSIKSSSFHTILGSFSLNIISWYSKKICNYTLKRFSYLPEIFNCYKYYDKVISVSNQTNEENKNNLARDYQIPLEKFDFVDNAINYQEVLDKSKESLPTYIENKYFQTNSITFINIARLSIEKDQEKLIRAFKEIHSKYPNTKLLILGDGPLKEHLQELIIDLRLKKSVFLLGRISNPFPYLKKSNCFIMSSNHEGQGLAMMEALILGKTIISTNFSCAYDVLDNGRYGKIIENNKQALVAAMEVFINQDLKFENFDYENYNNKTMRDFYHKICNHWLKYNQWL